MCFFTSSYRLRRQRSSVLAWLLLVSVTLLTTACESGYPAAAKQTQVSDKDLSRQVKTLTVREIPLERTIAVLGSLAAYDQAVLSTKVPGRVLRIPVDFGSGVEKGQILAEIEPRDYQLQEQQAEAALAQARVRLGLSPTGKDTHIDPEQTGTVKQARALLTRPAKSETVSPHLWKRALLPEPNSTRLTRPIRWHSANIRTPSKRFAIGKPCYCNAARS